MSERGSSSLRAEAGLASSPAARRGKPGALAAFRAGALPWGERPAGAPAGRGVRVFVIDCGSNPARAPGEAGDGPPGAAAARAGPCGDDVGNGKAITAVVRHVAPAAEVLAVRIFGRGVTTPIAVLEGALEYALRSKARVVSLGLPFDAADDRARVRALCRDALRDGVILVAAAREGEARRGFPAELPEVIGAVADARLGERSLRYVRGAPFECRAAGWPWPLEGRPRERAPEAHGFAAARVAGMIACILEARPRADLAAVREAIDEHFARRLCPRGRATGA